MVCNRLVLMQLLSPSAYLFKKKLNPMNQSHYTMILDTKNSHLSCFIRKAHVQHTVIRNRCLTKRMLLPR
jgi:hypothetical protein